MADPIRDTSSVGFGIAAGAVFSGQPGAYGAYLDAYGKTQASYLSNMDSYYAQLDETVREFDATLKFKREELTSLDAYRDRSLDIAESAAADASAKWKAELESIDSYRSDALLLESDKLAAAEDERDFYEPYMDAELERREDIFDAELYGDTGTPPDEEYTEEQRTSRLYGTSDYDFVG